jgi:outer membrane protein TolC
MNEGNGMKLEMLLPAIILAACVAASTLNAQGLGAQEPLSLEQVRASALAHSRTLQKALLSVDSALLTEKLQRYERMPSITASAGASLSYPASTFSDSLCATAGLSVTQLLYDGGKSALLSALDAIDTRIAREEARAEYFSVLKAAEIDYYAVLEAHASVESAKSDLEAARTHLSLAEAKLEAKMLDTPTWRPRHPPPRKKPPLFRRRGSSQWPRRRSHRSRASRRRSRWRRLISPVAKPSWKRSRA